MLMGEVREDALQGWFLRKYLFRKLSTPCPPPSVLFVLGIIHDTPGLFCQFLGPVHWLDFLGESSTLTIFSWVALSPSDHYSSCVQYLSRPLPLGLWIEVMRAAWPQFACPS